MNSIISVNSVKQCIARCYLHLWWYLFQHKIFSLCSNYSEVANLFWINIKEWEHVSFSMHQLMQFLKTLAYPTPMEIWFYIKPFKYPKYTNTRHGYFADAAPISWNLSQTGSQIAMSTLFKVKFSCKPWFKVKFSSKPWFKVPKSF